MDEMGPTAARDERKIVWKLDPSRTEHPTRDVWNKRKRLPRAVAGSDARGTSRLGTQGELTGSDVEAENGEVAADNDAASVLPCYVSRESTRPVVPRADAVRRRLLEANFELAEVLMMLQLLLGVCLLLAGLVQTAAGSLASHLPAGLAAVFTVLPGLWLFLCLDREFGLACFSVLQLLTGFTSLFWVGSIWFAPDPVSDPVFYRGSELFVLVVIQFVITIVLNWKPYRVVDAGRLAVLTRRTLRRCPAHARSPVLPAGNMTISMAAQVSPSGSTVSVVSEQTILDHRRALRQSGAQEMRDRHQAHLVAAQTIQKAITRHNHLFSERGDPPPPIPSKVSFAEHTKAITSGPKTTISAPSTVIVDRHPWLPAQVANQSVGATKMISLPQFQSMACTPMPTTINTDNA